jgi:3-oxoacyl-[acyl-carrier-protein] synthase I
MSASVEARVGIIGAGARTALGRSLPASAAAVRAGIVGVDRHPSVVDRAGRDHDVARAAWLPEHLDGAARLVTLAENAAKEALAPLLRDERRGRLRVLVGLPEPRPGRPVDLDGAMARALQKNKLWGDRIEDVVILPRGHAAAILAIEQASILLLRGEADLCLAGGVDSYLDAATLRWLEEEDRIHTARRPWGFRPGEAAGFCLLASPSWLASRAAAPVSLLAVSSADEPSPIRTRTVCVGAGLTAAFDGALAPLSAAGRRVDRLIGDLNGEPYRADELGFALSRTADAFAAPVDVLAPAQHWGDVGAASGALFAGLAFAAATAGHGTGLSTLIWASSEGGARAAALLSSRGSSGEMEEP